MQYYCNMKYILQHMLCCVKGFQVRRNSILRSYIYIVIDNSPTFHGLSDGKIEGFPGTQTSTMERSWLTYQGLPPGRLISFYITG